MSHFTVGVITRDPHNVDYLLRPYDENGTDYYIKELYMSKEDYINSYKNEHPDTTLTDEQIYATANDMYTGVEKDGIYDYYNPDAKWDWYEIGGRWPNSLKVKKDAQFNMGGHYGKMGTPKGKGRYRWVDAAPLCEIEWDLMNTISPEQKKKASEFWDKYVLNQDPNYDAKFAYKREYYLDRYKTKEEYIKRTNIFTTHDLLVEDRGWITVGDMGWFGCDGSTYDSETDYIKQFYDIVKAPEYQNYWFVVVDCHI